MAGNKPWDKIKPYTTRPLGTKEIKQTFLIVCEGTQTEPNYFKSFRVTTAKITTEGVAMNTLTLVQEAIKIRDDSGENYNQVWVVFDKDSFPLKDFNAAIRLAKKNFVHLAYTNEAFELWYLLHFNYNDAALSRTTFKARLTKALEQKYEKNDTHMYSRLLERQETAIKNATKLFHSYNKEHPKDNPCTLVHKLVIELNKYIDP